MKYRFVNADLSMIGTFEEFKGLLRAYFGYDINCQHHIKFVQRIEEFIKLQRQVPEMEVLGTPDFPDIVRCIGKMHLGAHQPTCRYKFSMHWIPGAAMTDQEAAERNWSIQNGLSSRTQEMNPGYRHDVINDFYNGQNFRKTNAMCEYLPSYRLQHTYCIMPGKTLTDKAARADTYGKEMEEYLATLEVSVVQEKGEGELKKWKVEEAKFKADVVHTSRHDTLDNPYDPKTSKRAFEVLFVTFHLLI